MIDRDEHSTAAAASVVSAAEAARRLIDGESGPEACSDDARRMLAWALKDACYAAWSSEPRRAIKAAEALRTLADAQADPDTPPAREIAAVAAWTDGIARVAQGRMAQAAADFDFAASAFRALGQVQRAAETQVPKIMALSMLGQHAEATECAQQTLSEFLGQGDRRAAAKVSLNLGALHVRRGAYAQAARYSREAAVLFARVGDHEHSVMADINTADALTSMGNFDEAQRLFTRAARRADAHGFPVLQALVAESMGLLQLARGNYRDALAGLEGSRRRYEQLDMPQQLAIAEKQLADAYLELRLLPEALLLFDKSVGRFHDLDIPDEQAWALAQRGRVHALLAQPAHAADSFLRAAQLFAAQGNRVGVSAVLLARAELALARGDTEAAIAAATEAAHGFATADLADGHARADVVRAYALLRAGRIDAACALFDATLERARDLQLLPVQVRCLSGRGLAALADGDEAAARAAFVTAVELFEDQRRVLPGDEIRSAFLADNLLPYRELVKLALAAHAHSATHESAVTVLGRLERFRARTLSERLAQAPQDDSDPDTQVLRNRLNWQYRRLRRAQEDAEPAMSLTEEVRSTERELLERVRRNRMLAQVRQEPAAQDDVLDVDRLCAALGEDGALVEYGVIDDELFACIVTPRGASVHRGLARWSATQAAAQSALFQIETLRNGAAPVARYLGSLTLRARTRLQQLYALVWAPIAAALDPYHRVVVVPHAQLARLPFGALHDGARFLCESMELAFAPSARSALYGLERRAASPRQALVLGESASLKHAESEARFVAGLFPHATTLTGADATVAALRANAGHADLIHFACHAQFRGDNPMFSALHLHDGPLTAEAVEKLHLRPAIVVLSACETAVADGGGSDEMVGLARAFLVAGAARIVACLWPVDDRIAALFMTHFYSALQSGRSSSQALAAAQNVVMRRHPHPFYWAGFALYGGW